MGQPAIGLNVTSNIKGVRASFAALSERITDQALVRALNRANDQSATEASRQIRKVYNIRHAAVLRAMKKRRASRKNPEARLEIRGARIGVIEFGARQVDAGVSVKIKNAGGRDLIRHAFITSLAGGALAGYRGVFMRTGKSRYPIRALRSLSLPAAFRNKVVIEAVREVASISFSRNYRQQILFLSGGE